MKWAFCGMQKNLRWLLCLALIFSSTSCQTAQVAERLYRDSIDSTLYEVPVSLLSKLREEIPPGTRIVIADLEGDCGTEVKDALMRRLIENSDYTVLTRDNLGSLIKEADFTWSGRVDTRTATRLGDLLGASVFIVGRVVFCGFTVDEKTNIYGERFNILAMLRIIDLRTGEAIFASSSEGNFIPGPEQFLVSDLVAQTRSGKYRTQALLDGFFDDLHVFFKRLNPFRRVDEGLTTEEMLQKTDPCLAPCGLARYFKLKAAEDMANSFADRFFARPIWDSVQMWRNDRWLYSDSIRYVHLGQCPVAVEWLETMAVRDLEHMPPRAIAEYLHNYGVALLCVDRPQDSLEKLRASYRITKDDWTLKMIGLASRVDEWNLRAQVEKEPEIQRIVDQVRRQALENLEEREKERALEELD